MKRIIILCLSAISFLLVLPSIIKAQNTETLTISTYYPSPMGVYKNLKLFPTTAVPSCSVANDEGVMYYDNTIGVNKVRVCREISAGVFGWDDVGGSYWALSGTKLYPTNTTTWNVGIGTNNPLTTLQVNSGFSKIGFMPTILNNQILDYPFRVIGLNAIRDAATSKWQFDTDTVSNGGSIIYSNYEGDLYFADIPTTGGAAKQLTDTEIANSRRMVITSEGNVGIGLTGTGELSPQAPLDVAGEVKVGNTGLGCNSNTGGAVRYNNNQLQYCDGSTSTWKAVSTTQIKTGMYTGTGGGWTTINVGFQPKIVMLLPHGEGPAVWDDDLIIKMDIWPTSGSLNGTGYTWTQQYTKDAEGYDNPGGDVPYDTTYGIKLTATGFMVLPNTANRQYSWIAITW